jgi:hypothetical protein
MTSPITAEERAKALVQKLERDDAWDDILPEEMAPLIASAIREAETSLAAIYDKKIDALHRLYQLPVVQTLERAGIAARRQALEEAAQICDAEVASWGDTKTCSPKVVGIVASQIRELKGRFSSADPLKSTKETGHE